jgi:hypothetical protein
MKRSLIILITLLLSFLAGAVIPTITAAWLYISRPNAETEYWHGVYDVCMWQMFDQEMCRAAVSRFRAEEPERWYDAPSPGYVWPLPPASAPQHDYPSQQLLPGEQRG